MFIGADDLFELRGVLKHAGCMLTPPGLLVAPVL